MAPLSPADFLFCCPARSTDSVVLLPPADDYGDFECIAHNSEGELVLRSVVLPFR